MLKIGVLLDGNTVAHWQWRILQDLEQMEGVQLTTAIINKSEKKNNTTFKKLWTFREKIVWKIHEALDAKLFKTKANPFKRVDISALLKDLNIIEVRPKMTPFCDYLESTDFERIKTEELDVALRFGFRIIKGDFLKIAKAGIWSYHHADNRVNRGTPPGYWEVVKGLKLTGVTLQILKPTLDGGTVLARGTSSTHQLSIHRNKVQIYLRGIPFVKRRLKELQQLGTDAFLKKYNQSVLDIYDRPLYLVPGNFLAARYFFQMLIKGTLDALKRIWFQNQWVLLYLPTKKLDLSLRKSVVINPPKNAFWADPFGIRTNGRDYVFFEAYPYATKKGILAVVEIVNGKWRDYQVILDLPYHLSYPYVFQYQNDWYMIPETGSNKTISLYKCTDFPSKWEFQKHILEDCVAIDTSIFEWQGKWWFFTTLEEEPGSAKNEALYLYSADSPLADNWVQHPIGAIYTDVSKGRMAGRVFSYNGRLYRPAQDGSIGYGGAVKIFEITKLSPEVFEEVEVSHIAANWSPEIFRTHTFDFNGEFVMLDGLRKKRRFF
jgi:hypothetical protein